MNLDTADVSTLIGNLSYGKRRLEILKADAEFDGWRHDEEYGALMAAILNVRARAEEVRFLADETRLQSIRLAVRALPAARLFQLLEPNDEAGMTSTWTPGRRGRGDGQHSG
jgi:hypothetical protein